MNECNWCGEPCHHDQIAEAIDGSWFYECDTCRDDPCCGCEYERGDRCAFTICILGLTARLNKTGEAS